MGTARERESKTQGTGDVAVLAEAPWIAVSISQGQTCCGRHLTGDQFQGNTFLKGMCGKAAPNQ